MGPPSQRNLLQGPTDQSQGIPVIKSQGVGLGSPTAALPPSVEQRRHAARRDPVRAHPHHDGERQGRSDRRRAALDGHFHDSVVP